MENKIEYKEAIIKKISRDLNIKKYENEDEDEYKYRLILSSMSLWIRIFTLDNNSYNNTVGNTKKYIKSKSKQLLDKYYELYPEIEDYFNKEKAFNEIKSRLYNVSELIDVGHQDSLALRTYSIKKINNISLLKGFKNLKGNIFSGLGIINKDILDVEETNIYDLFLLEKNAIDYINDFFSSVTKDKWQKRKSIDDLEFFDYNSKYILSDSFITNMKSSEINIYRKKGYNNSYDYGLIKKVEDKYNYYLIDSFLIDNNEVRRMLYGIKAKENNKCYFYYKKLGENYILLTLYSMLPAREESILLFYSWQLNGLSDDYRDLVFHISLLPVLKEILSNLCIELKEK